jgi:hypothetical protein
MAEVKSYKVLSLPSSPTPDSIYWVKGSSASDVIGYITDRNGVPYPLKDISGSGGITTLTNTDGNLVITGADNKIINLAPALLSSINSALQSGANISELVNDAGFITVADIPTKTSDLTNDGEDGVNPFITLEDIPPVTGFVPYTGATQDVDLGEYEIKAGQVEFDQTPTGTAGVGVMRWNDTDGTLDLGLKGGNVTLQIGQEQLVRAVNKTTTNINLLESNYQAVRVTGAQGQRLKVDLAQATSDLLSAETIGLVTETINNNQEGFITISGLVRNINTTGSLQGETWADGDILYLSPTVAGRVTNVKPTAPNHLVIIGYVVYAHANNGKIFVKVDNGYKLEELHNVTSTNYTTPIDTDSVLTLDVTTSLWKRLSWSNIKSNLKTYFDTIYQTALGFTPENVANKENTTLDTSATKYPTNRLVKEVTDAKLDKVTTSGVERAYIINADGSQGTKATSEFKDVLEFANLVAFPATGESGKIYVALDTNKTYRWSGSAYTQIGGGSDFKVVHKNHISGASVVNNPNFTYKYLYGVLIPAGTFQEGDFIDIEASFVKLSGGTAEVYPRLSINSIDSTIGEQIISFVLYNNTAVYCKIQRSLVLKSPTLTEILHHGANSITGWNQAATSGNKNINWNVNQYIVVSLANNGATDANWRMSSIIITKK